MDFFNAELEDPRVFNEEIERLQKLGREDMEMLIKLAERLSANQEECSHK